MPRSASVLTKNPINGSISRRWRLATGDPMVMSVCPLSRAMATRNADSIVTNIVALAEAARRRSAPDKPESSANGSDAPANPCTGGRGKSTGSASACAPPSRACQYAI